MKFFNNEGNEVVLNTGDFVAFYFKPNDYLAVAIQTTNKKMLYFFESSEKKEYFLFEPSTPFEEVKKNIEEKIGFYLNPLEGKHKENNLGQFGYSFIPAKNKKKDIITTVFKIGNPV